MFEEPAGPGSPVVVAGRCVERAVLGAEATVVELGPDGAAPTFHLLHARDGREPVYVVDTRTGDDILDPD